MRRFSFPIFATAVNGKPYGWLFIALSLSSSLTQRWGKRFGIVLNAKAFKTKDSTQIPVVASGHGSAADVSAFALSTPANDLADPHSNPCLGEHAAQNALPLPLPRRDVKLHWCNSARAKDANIRQALIDRYGKPGVKKETWFNLRKYPIIL